MTDQYAVIGNPIEHSKSPLIHSRFAQLTDQDLSYEQILGNPDDFKGDIDRFFKTGGRGLNVTVPFKERAWALVDERSERAETAGAVNTLIPLPNGRLSGDNTDGVGLVRDLQQNHHCPLMGKKILLLGAGGAARGVLRPLLETNPQQLTIANRTASKAVQLAADVAGLGAVSGCGLDALEGRSFDLIINATAAGLKGKIPPLPEELLRPEGWCYDMMYATEPTRFVRWGQEHGAVKALDGLGMLVEQAAESFYLWRGVRPETASVIEQLRDD
ncbi:MAG: shikimate dehydrogenase [Gammaproteobacteria bacterium]|nr:shikimate dehydrogenase [Gammaproteobacteria bacterium]